RLRERRRRGVGEPSRQLDLARGERLGAAADGDLDRRYLTTGEDRGIHAYRAVDGKNVAATAEDDGLVAVQAVEQSRQHDVRDAQRSARHPFAAAVAVARDRDEGLRIAGI